MYVHSTDTKIFNKYHFSCPLSETAGLLRTLQILFTFTAKFIKVNLISLP